MPTKLEHEYERKNTPIKEPHTPDQMLRDAVFRGLTTNQIKLTDGVAVAANQATEPYIKELSEIMRTPIVPWPEINEEPFNKSRIAVNKQLNAVVAEMHKRIEAANHLIDNKYNTVSGVLGAQLSPLEYGAHDGFFRRYERGAIYVTGQGQAFEVHGDIYKKYLALGAEGSSLGYPQTDELSTTLGTGRFNHFQGGSIYWTVNTGAWELHGAIRDKWWALDGDRSHLGYPVSDEENWPEGPGRISHFQRGRIVYYNADGNVQVHSDSIILQSRLENNSVTCSLELWMNSIGDWRYKGHMHNSGFVGFSVNVASTPKFQDAHGNVFACMAEHHLGGTTSPGSRDYDWDNVGSQEAFIRENWDSLRTAGLKTTLEVDFTFGDFVGLIGVGFAMAVGTIIFGTLLSGGKVCGPRGSMKRNPQTGLDEPEVSFDVIPADQKCPP